MLQEFKNKTNPMNIQNKRNMMKILMKKWLMISITREFQLKSLESIERWQLEEKLIWKNMRDKTKMKMEKS